METSDPVAWSLRLLALRGSAWALVGVGLSQVLRLGGNLILTRLLFPEAFGLMALVTTLVAAIELFSDFGIAPSIVQNPRGNDPDFLNTAWVVQIVRGLAAFAAACALALPFARFYAEPALASLVIVSALGALIAGSNSTKLYTARRNLAVARVTALELVAQAVALGVMLGWALVDRSVWALVAGALAASSVRLAASHLALPGPRNRIAWDPAAWRALYAFGRWIFVSTILTFLSFQSDRLIFGAMVSIETLGLYFIGSTLASIPVHVMARLEESVIFPLYGGVLNRARELAPVFYPTRQLVVLATGWVFAVLAAVGPAIIDILYDPRYEAAAPFLQILAVGAWLRMLVAGNGMALLANGRPQWVAAANGAKLSGMAALVPLGYATWGFEGAVAGFSASELLSYATLSWGASRLGLSTWRGDALSASIFALATWLGLVSASSFGESHGPLASFVAGTLAVSAVWLPLAGLQSRELARAIAGAAASAFRS